MPLLRLVGFYYLSEEIPVVNCYAELIFLVESNNFYFLLLFESTVRLLLISGYIVFLLFSLSIYGLEEVILREFSFGM